MRNEETLRKEIENAINRNSAENGSNTPDFILAKYLVGCLKVFDETVTQREKWYGREKTSCEPPTSPDHKVYTVDNNIKKICRVEIDHKVFHDAEEMIHDYDWNQLLESSRKSYEESMKKIPSDGYVSADGKTFYAIPKMKKPMFWEFWKRCEYKAECNKILEEYKKWKSNVKNV